MMRTYTRKRPDHQLIENVHELCRLCLSETEADGVVPIFTDDTTNVCAVLALRIMICVGLEMKREDCLPNKICTECLNNLNKYYTFRKQCEVSYQKLKSHALAVKEKQYKIKIEQQNEAKNIKRKMESDDDLNFVVTFDKNQPAKVSLLNLNSVTNANNLNDKLSELPKADSTENRISVLDCEEQLQETYTAEPDITTFLSTVLLQLGILTQQDSGLVFTEESISTLELETGDGNQVTLELVEEDDMEQEENMVMEQSPDPVEDSTTTPGLNNVVIKYITSNFNNKLVETNKKQPPGGPGARRGAWCAECGKQLASRSALARHKRVHSGEKPFVCAHCGRAFAQREVLRRHALVHEDQRPFACDECGKSFTQRGALAAHARAHAPAHARALSIHRCARCPKVFLYASGLSRHMMMHLGRVYVCGACERQFRDKSSLMRHLKRSGHDT